MDPLGYSQVLSYQKYLASRGWDLTIISFEKEGHKSVKIKSLESELSKLHIKWIALKFKYGKLQYLFRIIYGIVVIRFLSWKNNYLIVHVRGIQAASLVSLAYISAPLIYDIRAFAGEWIDCGRVKPNGIIAKYLINLENKLIRKSAGIVVLDESGYRHIEQNFEIDMKKVSVIPTCTDLSKYGAFSKSKSQNGTDIKFVFLGGAIYPYRSDLALLFIKQLISLKINCTIDFINDRDQDIIKSNAESLKFPSDRIRIFRLEPNEVASKLQEYDSGLVFNSVGKWRKMSSPTKIGEYLASGLHVVGLSGINALDRLAEKHNKVVNNIDESRLICGLKKQELYSIIEKINNPCRKNEARRVAESIYSLKVAQAKYEDLYNRVALK